MGDVGDACAAAAGGDEKEDGEVGEAAHWKSLQPSSSASVHEGGMYKLDVEPVEGRVNTELSIQNFLGGKPKVPQDPEKFKAYIKGLEDRREKANEAQGFDGIDEDTLEYVIHSQWAKMKSDAGGAQLKSLLPNDNRTQTMPFPSGFRSWVANGFVQKELLKIQVKLSEMVKKNQSEVGKLTKEITDATNEQKRLEKLQRAENAVKSNRNRDTIDGSQRHEERDSSQWRDEQYATDDPNRQDGQQLYGNGSNVSLPLNHF